MAEAVTPGQARDDLTDSGQLVSATRFAAWTGTSRERLRTWERRHGFPAPVRTGAGPRRYRATDAARVVAVRRAVEDGVPLADAIARSAGVGARAEVGAGTLATLTETAPVPVAIVSGPSPLRVEWVNGALRALPGAPGAGEPLEGVAGPGEGPAAEALRERFASGAPAAELEHVAWGDRERSARSAAFALPTGPGGRPLVALLGLEGGGRRLREALAAAETDLADARERTARQARRLAALAVLARAAGPGAGPVDLDAALDALAGATGAADATLATCGAGTLDVAASLRGRLEPASAPLAALPGLARALAAGEPVGADAATRAALGAPAGTGLAIAPVVVAAQPLGALVLLHDEPREDDEEDARTLGVAAAIAGLALLRDALARRLGTGTG